MEKKIWGISLNIISSLHRYGAYKAVLLRIGEIKPLKEQPETGQENAIFFQRGLSQQAKDYYTPLTQFDYTREQNKDEHFSKRYF